MSKPSEYYAERYRSNQDERSSAVPEERTKAGAELSPRVQPLGVGDYFGMPCKSQYCATHEHFKIESMSFIVKVSDQRHDLLFVASTGNLNLFVLEEEPDDIVFTGKRQLARSALLGYQFGILTRPIMEERTGFWFQSSSNPIEIWANWLPIFELPDEMTNEHI